MNRLGTILTFKAAVTKAEAARALQSIAFLLDLPASTPEPNYFINDDGRSCVSYTRRPFVHADLVNEFDDDIGGPVWYIP